VVSHPIILVYSILIVDFSLDCLRQWMWLVKLNHLNSCVVCDCLYLLFHVLLIFRNSQVLENMIYFLTTGIRAFGSSGSDAKRRR
jgi:hypothetical protein